MQRALGRLIVLVGMVFGVVVAQAQTVVITKVKLNAPPALSTARAYAFDASGGLQSLGQTDVAVAEDGTPMSQSIQCDPPFGGRNISLMVAADVSASSLLGAPSSIDMERSAALAANGALGSAADEIGLVSFDQRAFVLMGLTTNRTSFPTAVTALQGGKGSSLANGLTSEPMGALTQLNIARHARTLLLLVDGRSTVDAAALLATARTFRITVYVIGLRSTLGEDLRMLADSTGGAWTESVTTIADAEAYARAYVTDAKRLPGCTISWTSPFGCTDRRTVTVTRQSVVRTANVAAPAGLRGFLDPSTTSLSFGEVAPGQDRELTLTLTARNTTLAITDIRSSDPAFVVSGIIPAIILNPDQTVQLRVRYNSADSAARLGVITIETEACGPVTIYAKAGFRAKDNLLRVTSPNGGEQLTAGADTLIRWSGVLPSDIVRIDVSDDNGTTWRSVTEAASGLQYNWTPGPVTSNARIRIQQTLLDPSKIVVLADHAAPVYAADFLAGGTRIVTGSHDRTAGIWNAATGQRELTLRGHRDWVWAVAAHPSQQVVATGAFDGDVRIWSATDGTLLSTITFGPRVWSLDFNTDGTRLAVAFEGGIGIIDMTNGTVIATTNDPGAPVHSITYVNNDAQLLTAEGNSAVLRSVNDIGTVLRRFTGHVGPVYAAAMSPDGSTVATAGADRTVRTWNAATAALVATSDEGVASYLDVEFNANGAQILAASGDGTAKFLETSSLRRLNSLAGHNGLVYTARFDRSYARVVTAATDLTARVWDIGGLRLAQDVSDQSFVIRGGTVTSLAVELGDVVVGYGRDASVSMVRNTGSAPLTIRSIRLKSGDLDDFDLTTLAAPVTLDPNGSLVSEVRFAPTSSGARTAIIEVVTGVGTFDVTMNGRGVVPAVGVPQLVNFGRRVANRDVIDTTIAVVIPTGAVTANVLGTTISGPSSAPFSFYVAETPYVLEPGQTHPMRIRFQPTDLGRFAARVTIDVEAGEDVVMFLYGEGAGDAQIQTSQAIVFETQPCSTSTSTREFTIQNRGNSTMTVYDVAIEGQHASEFVLTPPITNLPFTVAPEESRRFTVQFSPAGTGTKSAQAVIVSDALNAVSGRTTLQLVARQDSVGYELSRPNLIFTPVPDAEVAEERLQLINTGTVALRWPRTSIPIDGRFTILSIRPDITPVGGTSEVIVRFTGGNAGSTYTASYTFRDSICSKPVDLNISATVKSYIGITVRVDTSYSTTGSTIDVPVYVTHKVNLDRTSVRTFTADVTVNATILFPQGSTPQGTLNAEQSLRTIPMTFTIPEGGDSLAGTLRFSTLWGNDTASAVRFSNVQIADTVRVLTRDGQIVLSDLCREGGPRLYLRNPFGTEIRVTPQPSTGPTTIDLSVVERGNVRLELVDMSGRIVSTMVDRALMPGTYIVPFNTTDLPAGPYFLVLTTPSDRISRRVDVAK